MGGDFGGGVDPDEGYECDDAQRPVGVVEGERNRDEIESEGGPVLVDGSLVFLLERAAVAETPEDGEAQQHEAKAGDDHGGGVEGYGEGVQFHIQQVRGEEGEQRETEEEEEIGVEDGLVGFFGAVDEVVVVYPVDGGEGERESVDGEGGEDGAKAGEAGLVGDFELKHHDGDDDGDDSVGEGF